MNPNTTPLCLTWRDMQGELEAVSSKLEAEKSAKSELEYHKEKLQMVLKEATSKLEADLRSSATHT